jgi:hydroxymethylpyrimidine pyrophosphatase-like HAD family hydrolase
VRIRLLALDIDGTLLDSDKKIAPRTRAAVEKARARGVRVVLVTGRRHPSARSVALDLGGHVPLVLHNGALIIEDGVVLRVVARPRETASATVRLGRAGGADPVVHCGLAGEGRLLIEGVAPSNTLLAYYLDKSHPDVSTVPDLEAALVEDPLQVMFGGTIEAMDALLPPLRAALGGSVRIERTVYPRYSVGLLDVLHPAVGKAEAVAFLERRWGIDPAETMAIGDNWNDHEMLERAGVGLVMGNADPPMLQLGLPVLPTNDDEGVAVAIERYIL